MSSKRKINFELVVPHNDDVKNDLKTAERERIKLLKNNIKEQYEVVHENEDVNITQDNQKKIEDLILATKDLIDNCIKDSHYSGNKDENYVNLIYLYHKLDLKLETYRLETKINEIDEKSVIMEDRQNKAEEQSNNLVYNLLGFLTTFSIVSASVEAISKIQGIINIMLFMTFTIFLLLTALIALHNFYKNDNKRETKLQDNYFLWKVVLIVIIVLSLVLGIKTINDNKENIFNYIDNRIEKAVEEKLELKN